MSGIPGTSNLCILWFSTHFYFFWNIWKYRYTWICLCGLTELDRTFVLSSSGTAPLILDGTTEHLDGRGIIHVYYADWRSYLLFYEAVQVLKCVCARFICGLSYAAPCVPKKSMLTINLRLFCDIRLIYECIDFPVVLLSRGMERSVIDFVAGALLLSLIILILIPLVTIIFARRVSKMLRTQHIDITTSTSHVQLQGYYSPLIVFYHSFNKSCVYFSISYSFYFIIRWRTEPATHNQICTDGRY